MLKKNYLSILISGIITIQLLIFGACESNSNPDDFGDISDNNSGDLENTTPIINEDAINEIIGSFSSPVEMAAVMKSLEVPFSKKYLINPAKTENYDTNDKKAFALGILSADLGYLNVYEKTNLIVQYLSAIKRISDDLRVSQFFDFQALKRLAASNDNIDSLQFLSVQSFRDMDQYLRQSNRSSLSLLAITGVWIESLYLLTQVAKNTNTEKLKERIGEQKILFNLLNPIITIYKDKEYFAKLAIDLKEIQNIFDEVNITYEKGEAETNIENGHVTIIQNEKSVVNMTDEQLKQIIETTKKIRNKLINL